ncbi:MAG: alkaline phosphatase family protein [Spirochaetia bacterium]
MHLGKTPIFALIVLLTAASLSAAEITLPRYDHVVLIIEENHSLSQVAESPYLASLASRGVFFTRSFAVAHPSQPNYLALFSGSTHGVQDDGHYDLSGPNLALSLASEGLTFVGYSESLPRAGFRGDRAGDYVRKHNPWASFTTVPDAVNQPLTDFPSGDFAALPVVSFVIPNLRNDMHDGSVREGDAWLLKNMEDYARWAVGHNSLLIVTFDEGPVFQFPAATPIATIIVGAHVRPGSSDQPITHYSVLRTIEDIYGLPPIGEDRSAQPITGIWD